jgi:hypothetical protein
MRPPRVSTVLLFLCVSLCVPGSARSQVTPAVASGERVSGTAVLADPVSVASGDEKQPVPKSKTPTRTKPAQPKSTPSAPSPPDTDNDDETDASCFFDCLGAFLGSLFHSTAPPPAPALGPENALRAEAGTWAVGESGRLRAASATDSVALWDGPGGADDGRAVVGILPDAVPVIVVETHSMATGLWLRVRPTDGVEPIGWVPASTLGSLTEPPSPEPAPKPRRKPTWGIMVAAGGGGVGPSPLNVEYKDGVFRTEAQYMRYLPQHWQSGAGIGWRQSSGQPRVDYAYSGSTLVDVPSDSRLEIFDIGVRAGVRHGGGKSFRFSWLLGPALYHVHEHAEISVVESTTGFQVGNRHESLNRWAGGGDVRLSFGWLTKEGLEIGLVTDGYMMAWTGQHELSLTTDFLGKETIHGFDVAVSITIPSR